MTSLTGYQLLVLTHPETFLPILDDWASAFLQPWCSSSLEWAKTTAIMACGYTVNKAQANQGASMMMGQNQTTQMYVNSLLWTIICSQNSAFKA